LQSERHALWHAQRRHRLAADVAGVEDEEPRLERVAVEGEGEQVAGASNPPRAMRSPSRSMPSARSTIQPRAASRSASAASSPRAMRG
jgi:hypothetical protein